MFNLFFKCDADKYEGITLRNRVRVGIFDITRYSCCSIALFPISSKV